MNPESISFLHISDTHLGNSKDFTVYGLNTYQITAGLIDLIKDFDAPVDFVVHTGDILNYPDNPCADLARKLFSNLSKPLFLINGNHDSADLTSMLQTGNTTKIGSSHNSSYFLSGGHAFLFVDAQGKPGIESKGTFTEDHHEDISNFLNNFCDFTISVFVHFPPVPLNSPWVDNEMLLENGSRFHDLLALYSNRISGVFFGHLHHRVSIVQDSILYSGAPSPFCSFGVLPTDREARFDLNVPISCNYVTLKNGTVIVKDVTSR